MNQNQIKIVNFLNFKLYHHHQKSSKKTPMKIFDSIVRKGRYEKEKKNIHFSR